MWQEKRFLFFFSFQCSGMECKLHYIHIMSELTHRPKVVLWHASLSMFYSHGICDTCLKHPKFLIRKKEYTIVCVKIRAWIVNALRSFVTRVVCAKILAPFFPFPSQFKDDSTFYLSLCRIKHTEIIHLFKNRTFYAANCVGSDELELHFE